MASPYATKLAEGFSAKTLEEIYDRNLATYIVNEDYEGEINNVGSVLNILSFAKLREKTYTKGGTPPIAGGADDLEEVNTVLTITEKKSFYWKEMTIDKWASYIKDPHPKIVTQVANERMENIDKFVFSFYPDVAAGNRVGTDEDAGTVKVSVAGVVTGTETAFDSSMVGRGFKADGHTKWYRVKEVRGVTDMTIEDDSDDEASAYTGGAISDPAGIASYVIEAVTPIVVTPDNLLATVALVKEKLDKAGIPDEGRWMAVPPEFETALFQATGIVLNVPAAFEDLIKRGLVTYLLGFQIFRSNRLSGDNVNGYHILAGHSNWMTFAEKVLDARIEEDITGDFGAAFKDLFVYGAKVADSRRKYAAELFATFAPAA